MGHNLLPIFGSNFATTATAYHLELNGAVERLYRRLKDALCARTAAVSSSEDLLFVLLGLRAQPREDAGLSLAEAVFGAPIVLPNEFLHNDKLSVDSIVKNFSKTLHVPASSLPRHNSSTQLPSKLPAELFSAPLVWVRRGGIIPPCQPLYDGPYAVLRRVPCSFTIRIGSRDEVIAVSRLKACTAADAMPGSPHNRGRPPGSHPGGPTSTKRVSFADPLVSSPSSPAPPQNSSGTVFLPGEEVFARPGLAPPSQAPQMPQATGSHPGSPAATKRVLFADPLVSSPSSPALPQYRPGTVFLLGEEVFARLGPAAPSQPPQTQYLSRQWAPPKRLDL
jgi:hypothetical protein